MVIPENVMKQNIPVSRLVEFASGRLTPEEGLKLLVEIEEDPRSSMLLEKTIELLNIAGEADWQRAVPQVPTGRRGLRYVREKAADVVHWTRSSRTRLALIGFGLLVAVAAVVISPLPGQERLASRILPTDEEVNMVVRGEEKGEVDLAAHLMASQRFADAARVLEWYLSAFPNANDIAEADFLAGLAHLRMSRRVIIGIFAGIDRDEARRAEAHLMSALVLAQTHELSAEASWYLARTEILLRDGENARHYLHLVIKERGVHSAEAILLEQDLAGR